MANQIKNKYTVPSVTEFSTKDLVIDITRGKLYYKSNYAIYELTGKLISTNITDPSFLNLIEGDTTTTTGGGSVTINSDADNRVITALGTGQLQAESNLTFDGTNLGVTNAAGLTFNCTALLVNQANEDAESRFGSDADDNLLTINPGLTNRIGIGTITPTEKLTVTGNISASGVLIASASIKTGLANVVTYDTATDRFHFTSSAAYGGSGETNENSFQTIAVAGQSNVVADTTTDTLTFAAGSNMTITTNASSDTITFASSGGSTDNLGNHTATQDLDLNSNDIKNVTHITASGHVSASNFFSQGTTTDEGGQITLGAAQGRNFEYIMDNFQDRMRLFRENSGGGGGVEIVSIEQNKFKMNGHITASGNISSSGIIECNEFRCANQLTITPDTSTFDPNFDGTPGIDSVTPRIRLHSVSNLGVLDFSNSDDVFLIRPDSVEKIRIRGDGKTSFHNDVAVDTSDEPTISLAIGHADTGFNSLSTDNFRIEVDGTDTMRFESGAASANTTTGGGVYIENIASNTGAITVKIDTSSGKLFFKSSTRNIKSNIVDLDEKTINSISDLRPVKYNPKADKSNNKKIIGGFIAEEVAEHSPLFAIWGNDHKYDDNGNILKKENGEWDLKSKNKVPIDVDEIAIIAALVGKVQQLEKRINELEKK